MAKMNKAIQLANWIEYTDFYQSENPHINDTMDEVEAMLRHQQAEIEALKDGREHDLGFGVAIGFDRAYKTIKAKTLTDEEILDICIMGGFYDRIEDPFFDKKTGAWSLDEDLIEFARAILRKAQEK
jgi:hypothetical protein